MTDFAIAQANPQQFLKLVRTLKVWNALVGIEKSAIQAKGHDFLLVPCMGKFMLEDKKLNRGGTSLLPEKVVGRLLSKSTKELWRAYEVVSKNQK